MRQDVKARLERQRRHQNPSYARRLLRRFLARAKFGKIKEHPAPPTAAEITRRGNHATQPRPAALTKDQRKIRRELQLAYAIGSPCQWPRKPRRSVKIGREIIRELSGMYRQFYKAAA